MTTRRALVMLAGGLLAACAAPVDDRSSLLTASRPQGLLEVASGRVIGEAELVRVLRRAQFVLLGEEHGNLEHHRLQARIVRALGDPPGRLKVVAFEMIPIDRQQAVAEHLADHGAVSAGLGDALDWSASGWPPFEAYRPVFDAALAARAQIVAANLTRQQVGGLIGEGFGVLPPSLVRRTGLDRPLPPQAELALSRLLAAAHCERVPVPAITGMVRVQRARDALMAERLVTVSGRGQGVLIAGATHVRNDWGVPSYIRELRPGADVVSLAFRTDAVGAGRPGQEPAFDYVWLTRDINAPGFDPCGPVEDSRDGLRTAAASLPG